MKPIRYFQWIKGENEGEVVTLDSITEYDGEYFYNFSDGESCNLRFISKVTNNKADLANKFIVEVNSPSNIWGFSENTPKTDVDYMTKEVVEIPTLHDMLQSGNGSEASITDSDLGKMELIAPRRRQIMTELPSYDDYKENNEPVVIEEPSTPAPVVVSASPVETVEIDNSVVEEKKEAPAQTKKTASFDPVKILVDGCKKNPTDIDMTLTISLPGKAVYQIAESNFDNGGSKFIDFIVDDIDTSILINSLKDALSAAYGEKCAENKEDK